MTLEEMIAIVCGIWCIVCLVGMAWCRKNTYILGIGWAIKNKISCLCERRKAECKN